MVAGFSRQKVPVTWEGSLGGAAWRPRAELMEAAEGWSRV